MGESLTSDLSTAQEIASELTSADGVPEHALPLFDKANIVFAHGTSGNVLYLANADGSEPVEMLQVAREIVSSVYPLFQGNLMVSHQRDIPKF